MNKENSLLIRVEDLINNPCTRVPVCLCLDTSGSMGAATGDIEYTGEKIFDDGREWNIVTGGTSRIKELQKGIEQFYEAIREDEVAQYSAEICIVQFNDTAECLVDFANIERQETVPILTVRGNTAMGEGVNLALDLLEKRKEEYREKGIDYFQPWLILMTDGEANGSAEELQKATLRTTKLISEKKLTIFPIGIGDEADMQILEKFSPNRRPLKLQGLKFKEFFSWLSKSVVKTSQSTLGEKVLLDMEEIKGWGEL